MTVVEGPACQPGDVFRHSLLRLVGPAACGHERIVLVGMAKRYEKWSRRLLEPVFLDVKGKFVPAEFALSPFAEGLTLPIHRGDHK